MNSNQDIYNLYNESVVCKEARGHGDIKAVMSLLKQAMADELVRVEETRNGYMVKSNVDESQYLIHKGDSALHNLRRYIQGLQKIAGKSATV